MLRDLLTGGAGTVPRVCGSWAWQTKAVDLGFTTLLACAFRPGNGLMGPFNTVFPAWDIEEVFRKCLPI